MAESAFKNWEFDNSVALLDTHRDALYDYSSEEQKALQTSQPWKHNPSHFKHVRISAVALLKMVMHARSGGSLEVMGLMQGKIMGDSFIVTDAFRLPVEGTETRVNAQNEANEYMPAFLQSAREAGQLDNAVGWYHSHPGYGCWLSGIDVGTQMTQQAFSDPFLAVVIDPDRTISAGKVEIGAFRTYPENYKPETRSAAAASRSSAGGGAGSRGGDGYQTIPLAKIDDFGAHSSKYYSLEISHFKSSLDSHLLELLWNKYWVSTLSQSPLFTNREYSSKQMQDLGQKIRQAESSIVSSTRMGLGFGPRASGGKDSQLDKMVKDANRITGEEVTGLLTGDIKEKLFNGVGATASHQTVSQ